MAATSSPIPLVYRALFTYIDPLFCLMGLYTHLLDPVTTAQGYSPTTLLSNNAIGTRHMLDNIASLFAMLFVVEGVLLRVRSHDVAVWRVVQAGGFFVDLIMVLGAVRQLSAEGRLTDVGRWTGDDWQHVAGNAGMGIGRLACALGLGIASGKGLKRT